MLVSLDAYYKCEIRTLNHRFIIISQLCKRIDKTTFAFVWVFIWNTKLSWFNAKITSSYSRMLVWDPSRNENRKFAASAWGGSLDFEETLFWL